MVRWDDAVVGRARRDRWLSSKAAARSATMLATARRGECSRRELLAPSCLPRAIQDDPREPENHLDRSGRYRRDLPDHDRRQSEQARARQSALPSYGTGDRQPRDFNGDHGPTLSSSRFPRASSTGLTPTWSIFLIEFHGVDGLTPGESHKPGPQEVVATVLAANRPSFSCSRGRAAWSAEGDAQTGIAWCWMAVATAPISSDLRPSWAHRTLTSCAAAG